MGQIQNSLNQLFTSGLHSAFMMENSAYARGQRAIDLSKQQYRIAKQNLEGRVPERIAGVQELMDKIEIGENATLEEAQKAQQQMKDLGDNLAMTKKTTQKAILAEMEAKDKVMEAQLKYGTDKQQDEAIKYLAKRDLEKSHATSNPRADSRLDQAGYELYGSLQQAYNQKRGVINATVDRLMTAKGGENNG